MNNKKIVIACSIIAFAALSGGMYYSKNSNNSNKIYTNNDVNSVIDKKNNTVNEKDMNEEVLVSKSDNLNTDVNTSKYMKYLLGIRQPSKQDLEYIEKAGRYGEEGFDAMMRRDVRGMLGENASFEKIEKIVSIMKEDAFLFDELKFQYASEDIDIEFFSKATYELEHLTANKMASILTDEEYELYVKSIPDNQLGTDIETLHTQQFFTAFSEIQQNNPEITTLDDVYDYIAEDKVKKLISLNEERDRKKMKFSRLNQIGQMSFQELEGKMNDVMDKYSNEINSLLTSEEKAFLTQGNKVTQSDSDLEEEGLVDEEG